MPAEPILRAARGRHPEDFWLNYALGEALRERKPAESVGFYRAALAIRPAVFMVQFELGMALWRQGLFEEAIGEFRRAVELAPKEVMGRYGLGMCFDALGRVDEAMAEYRRVIDLDPRQRLGSLKNTAGLSQHWVSIAAGRTNQTLSTELGGRVSTLSGHSSQATATRSSPLYLPSGRGTQNLSAHVEPFEEFSEEISLKRRGDLVKPLELNRRGLDPR